MHSELIRFSHSTVQPLVRKKQIVAERRTKGTSGTKEKRSVAKPLASLESPSSLPGARAHAFIPPHGGYQELLTYQKALIVYDATLYFCNRFFTRFDRTREQMIQAARSGKQNILEGSEASGTSKETEIKLTNTARASLKELLEDYRDFMRNRGIAEWTPDHAYARRLRQLNRTPGATYETFRKGIEHTDPFICANVIAGLIKVSCYLLHRQIKRLEQDFLREGGLRERMTRARIAARKVQGPQ
jgi:four helix bundle suffix protein